MLLPSSQGSLATCCSPSPHTVSHKSAPPATVWQNQAHSTEHAAEQPSAASVLWSSHSSNAVRMPSPHTPTHADVAQAAPWHCHPASTEHVWLHPSLSTRLLSSQGSPLASSPSPHVVTQLFGAHVPTL